MSLGGRGDWCAVRSHPVASPSRQRYKRPNHRIHGLKADVLSFLFEGDLGFGSVFRHQFQKPELVSGFFTSAVCASSGGTSRICVASGSPRICLFLARCDLSTLRFSLLASRACARSLPVLMRVSRRLVVLVKWLPPETEDGNAENLPRPRSGSQLVTQRSVQI